VAKLQEFPVSFIIGLELILLVLLVTLLLKQLEVLGGILA